MPVAYLPGRRFRDIAPTPPCSTSTGMSTMNITGTGMAPATRPASRTPTRIATRRWCTSTRIIPTCITDTVTLRPIDATVIRDRSHPGSGF